MLIGYCEWRASGHLQRTPRAITGELYLQVILYKCVVFAL
jgi:hypothetical protein